MIVEYSSLVIWFSDTVTEPKKPVQRAAGSHFRIAAGSHFGTSAQKGGGARTSYLYHQISWKGQGLGGPKEHGREMADIGSNGSAKVLPSLWLWNSPLSLLRFAPAAQDEKCKGKRQGEGMRIGSWCMLGQMGSTFPPLFQLLLIPSQLWNSSLCFLLLSPAANVPVLLVGGSSMGTHSPQAYALVALMHVLLQQHFLVLWPVECVVDIGA